MSIHEALLDIPWDTFCPTAHSISPQDYFERVRMRKVETQRS